MHHRTRETTITLARLLAMAIISAAIIVGAVIGCATAAKASTAPKYPPVVITTTWSHAFQLMEHGSYWCAIRKAPELRCTYYPWDQLPLMERPVTFRGAMRELRQGRAITRIRPHLWAWVWGPWF